jgi:murein DD-endopeptidase MepM/ murein hydrolase activator NlpD
MALQSCAGASLTIGNGLLSAIGGTSYLAEDSELNAAEIAYSQWEIDLLFEAQNAETTYPDYDEYRYNINPVGHDPIALVSFLTAKYDDFTFPQVEPVLRDIFNEQYELTFTEIVEVRYRTETRTDPETGEDYDVEVPYNWYVLETALTAQSFADIIAPLLTPGDEQDRYDVYNITRGTRRYVGSPFAFDWLPRVTSYFGWRVHPITGAQDFHRAIDIAVPAGTDILAGGDGMGVAATTHSL